MKRPRFWDVLVVRQDGQWVGFRAPWSALRRTASSLSFIFLLCVLSLTGWLLSRWQVETLRRELTFERLKSQSADDELKSLRGSVAAGAVPASETSSRLPALDAQDLVSSSFEIKDLQTAFDTSTQDLDIKFELKRLLPKEGKSRLSWIALLHGSQGVLVFPSAMASQSGELLVPVKGQVIEEFPMRRSIAARFRIPSLIEVGRGEALYVSVLVYDEKSSLLLKKRQELNVGVTAESGRK